MQTTTTFLCNITPELPMSNYSSVLSDQHSTSSGKNCSILKYCEMNCFKIPLVSEIMQHTGLCLFYLLQMTGLSSQVKWYSTVYMCFTVFF